MPRGFLGISNLERVITPVPARSLNVLSAGVVVEAGDIEMPHIKYLVRPKL